MGKRGPTDKTVEVWREERIARGVRDRRLLKKTFKNTINTGKIVSSARMAKGLTQMELSLRIGCSQKHVCRMEERGTINTELLDRVAEALGMKLKIELI